MLRNLRNSFRLLRIAYIMAREDALFVIRNAGFSGPLLWCASLLARRSSLPRAERLKRAVERLGPTFIKLGQTLSTRPDIIGEEAAEALGDLRDNLPPFASATAINIIESELRAPIAQLFTTFSEQPVAAASIAQVHKATLPDGKDVAVKILRPGIELAFARDLELFIWLAEIIERRIASFRRLKPLEVVRTFQDSVSFELDLRYEAAAATEMMENIIGDTGFRIPAIQWKQVSQRVLVMEWIDGIPLHDIPAIRAAGFDTNILLQKLSENFFRHVFRDGFFHADLHPGNLFVDKKGDIVAVDFGIMGRLDWQTRFYIADILRGFINEDYDLVAKAHFRAGYVPAEKSLENFRLACMAIAKPILDRPLHEISVGNLLGQLFKITETFEMETQPQLLLLQKTMVVVEGVGRMLNPEINMWEMAREPIESWATEHLGPLGKLRDHAYKTREQLQQWPEFIRKIERLLDHFSDPSGIRIHPESLNRIETSNRRDLRRSLQHQPLLIGLGILAMLGIAYNIAVH